MNSVFDAHLHIIDKQFPLWPNNGFTPDEFTCADYLARVCALNIRGGAVVSGSFQCYDQSYLIAALRYLNSETRSFVGVTQLPTSISDEELAKLDGYGVRAIRYNLYRGGSELSSELLSFGRRVYDHF